MKRNSFLFLVALSCFLLFARTGYSSDLVMGDVEQGKKVFKKCKACHQVGPKAKKRSGPILNQIVGTAAGQSNGFKYSKAMHQAAEEGLIWTPENLDQFLTKPKAFLPKTRMSFNGLKKFEDRANLIAYLATFSDQSSMSKDSKFFEVAISILALEGDVEYGQYLAGECTTCHQKTGDNDGIPGIVGLEQAVFVTAMQAYKQKHRNNEVMRLIAGRLSNEEIAALAAYFNGVEN